MIFCLAVQDVVSIMPSDHKLELYSNGECKSKIHNLQRLDKLLEFCKSDKTIAFHKGNFNGNFNFLIFS